MKRTIRWSVLMAILGFILGLGFLIPIPTYETREPASIDTQREAGIQFLPLELENGYDTLSYTEELHPKITSPFSAKMPTPVDRRKDVLFDIHTISNSHYAKNTDAYVVSWFRDPERRDEFSSFTYCHNYDYDSHSARTDLDRFTTKQENVKKAFPCYTITLEQLKRGANLITTLFGPVISLRSDDFDPRRGGTISVVFAHRVAKIGANDYRQARLNVTLINGAVKVTGPSGLSRFPEKVFNWLNLLMTEDFLGLPDGVGSISFFEKGIRNANYPGDAFLKADRPKGN